MQGGEFDAMTVEAARAAMVADLDDGTWCPCCGRRAKLYRRKINSTMARGLLWLARMCGSPPAWVNVSELGPRWLLSTRQLATVAHWELIEAKPNRDTSKRCSGIWRVTARGLRFCNRELRVPRRVHLFGNRIQDWSEETTDIVEALGDRFSYAELWSERAPGLAELQGELF